MKIYSVEEKPVPTGRRILVYAHNIKNPRWFIDRFTKHGGYKFYRQLDDNLYHHNISHWAELPGKPKA